MSDSDFNHFDEELLEVFGDEETYQNLISAIDESSVDTDCAHKNYFEDEGQRICCDCGGEIPFFDFAPEWRCYGQSDNRSSSNPSRCHKPKDSNRGGIDSVFRELKLELSTAIRKKTEAKYRVVVGTDTVRGKGRKGIVAACLLYVYRDINDVRTADEIGNMFGLSKQQMSDGIFRYLEAFPKDRTRPVKPRDLIRRMMRLTSLDLSHYQSILRIAKCLEDVDAELIHSSPQSVASAIVYLYLCFNPSVKNDLNLTKAQFAQKVNISDITISKLVKKSAQIIGCQSLTL